MWEGEKLNCIVAMYYCEKDMLNKNKNSRESCSKKRNSSNVSLRPGKFISLEIRDSCEIDMMEFVSGIMWFETLYELL